MKARGNRRERGAGLVEYALLVTLIAVVCQGAVTFFGDATDQSLQDSATAIGAAPDADDEDALVAEVDDEELVDEGADEDEDEGNNGRRRRRRGPDG